METRSRKRKRLQSLNEVYHYARPSLAYSHWSDFHSLMHVDEYDFRLFSGFETVWAALCCPVEDSLQSDLTFVQISQLALPASIRLPPPQ